MLGARVVHRSASYVNDLTLGAWAGDAAAQRSAALRFPDRLVAGAANGVDGGVVVAGEEVAEGFGAGLAGAAEVRGDDAVADAIPDAGLVEVTDAVGPVEVLELLRHAEGRAVLTEPEEALLHGLDRVDDGDHGEGAGTGGVVVIVACIDQQALGKEAEADGEDVGVADDIGDLGEVHVVSLV